MKITVDVPDTAHANWVERTNQRLVYAQGEVRSYINIAKTRVLTKDEQETYYNRTDFILADVIRELEAIHESLEGGDYEYPYPVEAKP